MDFEKTRPTRETLDVVGVGFGPSNLALAIAINEHNARGVGDPLTARSSSGSRGSAGTAAS